MLTGLALFLTFKAQPRPLDYTNRTERVEFKKFANPIERIIKLVKELLEEIQNQKVMKSDDRTRGEIEKLIQRLRSLKDNEFVNKIMYEEIEKLTQKLLTLRLKTFRDDRISIGVNNLLQKLDEETGVETYERTREGIKKLLEELRELREKDLYKFYKTNKEIEELIEELPKQVTMEKENKIIKELIHELQILRKTESYDKIVREKIQKLSLELQKYKLFMDKDHMI